MLIFHESPPPVLFFTGKGGVGKTSLACAAAVSLADAGKRVLLVSTDPASNLDEVLGAAVGHAAAPVAGCPGLAAVNIDPEQAAGTYREQVVGPYRGLLPAAAVAAMEEQLSGACTMEIAAFDEFVKLLGDPEATSGYDHVIFDTAPTGHTLRLLRLPAAWSHFLDTNTTGSSCLGPLSGLKQQESMYRSAVAILTDREKTALYLVARPDAASLAEAARTHGELVALGIVSQHLLINGVFCGGGEDPVAIALEERQHAALASMPGTLAGLPRREFPLLARAPLGIAALRSFGAENASVSAAPAAGEENGRGQPLPSPFGELLAELATSGSGLIMTMGKGGVGKTTIASLIAVELARRGHGVHLATTDPAAHLDFSLADRVERLSVSRIDPAAELERYQEKVMQEAGSCLDEDGKRLLAEDLRSPCTEEIAVFQAFAELLEKAETGFLVLDTAPTGHTLLLLDATRAYHRQVSQSQAGASAAVRKLLPRLRDPRFTKILLVTLPESTPVHEAAALQADLLRAEIATTAWVVNQSLSPLALSDPVLTARKAEELRFIKEITERHAGRVFLVPFQAAGLHA